MSRHSPLAHWGSVDRAPIKLLIVDDSVVMRSIIERMFETSADIEVVSKVATTTRAFEYLGKQQVDVILLDHEMPGQKGLEALPDMIAAAHGAHIVMLSSHAKSGSRTAVRAMALGATDAIEKPTSGDSIAAFSDDLVNRIRSLKRARQHAGPPADTRRFRPYPTGLTPSCIGIGASTGGIHALGELLAGGSCRFGAPVLITQHLPESFTPYYAQQVERMIAMPVHVAHEGDRLLPDHIYIAPGDASLTCVRRGNDVRITLNPDRDPLTLARPSVNVMFDAIAQCYGAGAVGLILTGMGRDGTSGAEQIVASGGAILAQDEDSSVVWGMPGSATRAGLASVNLPPARMFDFIRQQAGADA